MLPLMAEFLGGPYPVVWEDGELRPGRFLNSETLDYPEPVGKRTVYTATFHPEIWMLPHYLPEGKGKSIKYIDMMGGMEIGDLSMKDIWLMAIQRQAIKETFEKPITTGPEMLTAFGDSFPAPGNFKDALEKGLVRDEVHGVFIEVDGKKDGKEIMHTMYKTTVLADSIALSALSSVVGYCTAQCGVTVGLMLLRGHSRIING